MTINYCKYQATMKKIHDEAIEAVKAELNHKKEGYFGDENVAKVRRNNGDIVYYMTEEVVKEMLAWVKMQSHVLEILCYANMDDCTKKTKAAAQYIASLKPDEKYINSIKNAHEGEFMLDFYKDADAIEAQKRFDAARHELYAKKWGF